MLIILYFLEKNKNNDFTKKSKCDSQPKDIKLVLGGIFYSVSLGTQ